MRGLFGKVGGFAEGEITSVRGTPDDRSQLDADTLSPFQSMMDDIHALGAACFHIDKKPRR